MKTLNPKEKQVLDLVIAGTPKIDAVLQVYKCKNRNVAKSMSSKIFKRERVDQVLTIADKKRLDSIKSKLLPEWEKILEAPLKEGGISYDSKIKGLSYLSDKTLFNKEEEKNKVYQFSSKFIKVEKLNQFFRGPSQEVIEDNIIVE